MLAQRILHYRQKGQSLVETAIFLPILIILLGGVVEVSNLLVTQNRVQTAARTGTGFGAANYRGEDWDDPNNWAPAIAAVAKNNVTETLNLDSSLWDIWAIKARLNSAGTEFVEWQAEHADGTGNVVSDAEWDLMESEIKTDVIAAINEENDTGMEVVGTVAFHDRQSLLGMNAFNLGKLTRIRGLSVMRVDEPAPYTACDIFPIAVSIDNYSLHPNGTVPIPPGQEEFPFNSEENYGGNGYHWIGKSDSPEKPPPVYEVGNTEQFPYNEPGYAITQAKPGYLFLTKQFRESPQGGAFGWLRWNMGSNAQSAPTLAKSLTYPGDAHTYNYPPWSDDGFDKYDIIKVSNGAVNSNEVRNQMRDFIDRDGRTIRLPVFTPENFNGGDANGDGHGTGGQGNDIQYELYGFVIVKLLGWYLPGSHNWLLMEFVEWQDSCY